MGEEGVKMKITELFINRRAQDASPEPVQTVEPQISDALLRALLGGETITREKAMTLPAVSSAVDLITGAIATLPIRLYRRENGRTQSIPDDGRLRLLNADTGDALDAFQMKKAMVEDYLLGKGGYAYIRRDGNDVTGLFYVQDDAIGVLKNEDPIFKEFVLTVNGRQFRPYDFIKLLRNTKDGASGVGLTVEVAKALETAYQTLLYQLGNVRSGGSKRGFLKAQRKLGQEEINILKRAWAKLYENNEENVIVLNNGLEFQEASATSVEMQLNESKRTLADEIAAIFHVSDDFGTTYKKAIYPIIKAFETSLNRDLLLETEKDSLYFAFDTKELIKADVAERFNAYRTAKETGFLTINEIREMENLNTVEGMDVVNVGLSAVLYDTNTGKYFTPNTGTVSDTEHPTITDGGEPGLQSESEGDILEQRYNKNHGDDGRFSSGSGGSGTIPEGFTKPTLMLPKKEYANVYSEISTNYAKYEGYEFCVHITARCSYYFENHGFGEYNIYRKEGD